MEKGRKVGTYKPYLTQIILKIILFFSGALV
jgi:hypothetical protein